MDIWELAQRIEDAAELVAEQDPYDEELELVLLNASYQIRLREGDLGTLLGYWDDPRFEEHARRDYRPEQK